MSIHTTTSIGPLSVLSYFQKKLSSPQSPYTPPQASDHYPYRVTFKRNYHHHNVHTHHHKHLTITPTELLSKETTITTISIHTTTSIGPLPVPSYFQKKLSSPQCPYTPQQASDHYLY
ncbi:hypothetical protein DPMN_047340 [Dreissena polymorpha]|uniref:Uncharacterized protein n=1 Tax=Dreissena polymorpha TaxID=45954 RepID=A0A9D4DA68_DREPO|nr:hypothetical protein DPMN_047340 [Dreissena polymorpha]